MPKINQEEYEVLKGLDDKWKWIARSNLYGGKLEAHTSKPTRMLDSHWSNGDMTLEFLGGEHQFQFIQWEGEGPYSIAELIGEYEDSKEYKNRLAIEYFMDKTKESEETEVKNIEWLKDEILTDMRYLEGNREIRQLDIKYQTLREVAQKINSLDEPEVLSQDFIDENGRLGHFQHGGGLDFDYFVKVKDLQNLLVPKLEEITEEQAWEVLSELYDIPNKSYIREAMRVVAEYVDDDTTLGELKDRLSNPIIPQFVADWIEEKKPYNSLRVAFEYIAQQKRVNHDDELAFWVEEGNSETFARAWLGGYEVAEEPQYIIKTGDERFLSQLALNYVNNPPVTTVHHMKEMAIRFSDRELAHKVADLVNDGEVEELEE